LISKIYFPRIFIPLAHIGALLIDMALGLFLAFGLLLYYRWPLTIKIFALPLFIVGTMLAATGIGLTFSALNVSFRDMKYAVPFFIQMGIFVTPVIYPIRYVPEQFQYLLGLNPMTGMVAGFRYALLGTTLTPSIVFTSFLACLCMFIAGLLIFSRMELRFADII
jgi:lipopolysaccharide transport system permease protein